MYQTRCFYKWLPRSILFFLVSMVIVTGNITPEQVLTADSSIRVALMRVHPQLIQLTTEHPTRVINVIIQVQGNAELVKNAIQRIGGKVTADLPIINAVVAELPGRAVLELAQMDDVSWISWDTPMQTSACSQCVDTSKLINSYVQTVNADDVWNRSPYLQGQGIGVAVVDSGVNPQDDLYTAMGQARLVAAQAFNNGYNGSVYDNYGHGSHVAGVIGGNGRKSSGAYIGMAPMVNIINVKVGDDLNQGQGTASTVIAGLQWILQNKNTYNIRVVNMSLNSAVAESYHTNPIDAAVEILWFNKIVVVVSAGNAGSGAIYPPANDPFVITVGATNDKGTSLLSDDVIPSFSAYGTTSDGFAKPDLVAPGTNIIGLSGNINQGMQASYPANKVLNGAYFKMSGTSTAAPIVAGAIALLLQDEPGLTPDQVKYRLKATANKNWAGYNAAKAGAGYLDISAAVLGTTTQSANTSVKASALLWSGSQPITWGSVNWNSVNWNSVNWNSVNWNSVNWNSVNWNSDYWGSISTTSRSSSTVLLDGSDEGDAPVAETPAVAAPDGSDEGENSEQNKILFLPMITR